MMLVVGENQISLQVFHGCFEEAMPRRGGREEQREEKRESERKGREEREEIPSLILRENLHQTNHHHHCHDVEED
jgi:hypothetical protein